MPELQLCLRWFGHLNFSEAVDRVLSRSKVRAYRRDVLVQCKADVWGLVFGNGGSASGPISYHHLAVFLASAYPERWEQWSEPWRDFAFLEVLFRRLLLNNFLKLSLISSQGSLFVFAHWDKAVGGCERFFLDCPDVSKSC